MSPTVFKRNVHVDKVIELPFYYGFDVGLNVPADDVYKMLTIIEKHNAAELAKIDPTFAQIAKDMKGFQKRGVESSAESRADPSRASPSGCARRASGTPSGMPRSPRCSV